VGKSKISYDDYLRLLGLAKLAEDANRETERVMRAAARLLGMHEDDPYLDNFYGTHAYDALNGSRGMREALRLMEIEVEAPPDDATHDTAREGSE
jgi:hypothetical protein